MELIRALTSITVYIVLTVSSLSLASVEMLTVHSVLLDREIPIKVDFPNKPRSVVIFVHGGGCTFPAVTPDLGKIQIALLKNGHAVAIPNYRYGIKFPEVLSRTLEFRSLCEKYTKAYLDDLNFIASTLAQKYQLKIFFWGHSYGGYLVNHLATQNSPNLSIHGFISSNGWWKSIFDPLGLDMLAPINFDPINNSPTNLANIMILHTEDDPRIPVGQIKIFKNWITNQQISNYKIKVFESGGHNPLDTKYPLDKLLTEVLSFLDQ